MPRRQPRLSWDGVQNAVFGALVWAFELRSRTALPAITLGIGLTLLCSGSHWNSSRCPGIICPSFNGQLATNPLPSVHYFSSLEWAPRILCSQQCLYLSESKWLLEFKFRGYMILWICSMWFLKFLNFGKTYFCIFENGLSVSWFFKQETNMIGYGDVAFWS